MDDKNVKALRMRECSFRPEDHLIEIAFEGKEEKNYYLEVKWRVVWFQIWCDEHGIRETDRQIKELPVKIIEGTNLLQAECVVMAGGNELGTGVGAVLLAGDISYAVQQAATIAKGRALANAGFGTVFSTAIASENGGREIPADGGIGPSDMYVIRDPSNPMLVQTVAEAPKEAPTKAKAEPSAPAPQPKPESKPAPEPEKKPMTREEALKFPIPIRGQNFGVPLGEMFAKKPGTVKYYAEEPRYAGSELQEAAKLVVQ